MLRDFLATSFILLTSVSAFAADASVELTGKTLVTGNTVTVGDLFTNTGSYASHILAPSPDVGKKLVLSKNDLQRVVRAFHLDWPVPAGDVTVTLERDAVAVTEDDIAQALAKSDLQTSISANAQFTLNGFKPIVLDGQALPELTVTDTSFDPATERFTAILHIARKGETIKDMSLNGVATEMVSVPMLRHTLMSNAVISDADIIETLIAKKDLRGEVILSKNELLGQMPKRSLQPGRAISRSDVTPPLMIKRNELVTVMYKNGPIVLSTKARSLGSGGQGDTITLMNPNSKKPFSAVVTGPQQAEVNVATING